ncbi:uncharacterized protein LOC135492444 isoform X2 [Lineus longissimus]|uniref:uncharacterized protein LOC135492444 isoform X2 n=1 Tax=Lineus longissimus TaxID=88925 RepID=UPI00315D8749
MAQVYEKVVATISKPPQKRNLKEIQDLLPWFLKKSALFNSLKTDVVTDIIRNCQFVTKHPDDVIIKQGDQGDCFYIILSGKVAIYINNALADEDNLTGTVEEEKEKAEEELLPGEEKKKKKLDRSQFGNYIAQIDAGKSFGELALISKSCVRNASIIADEVTDLLVVNRDLYNRSLRAAQIAEFEEKNKFVTENPLFANWQAKFKRQMAMSIVKQKVPYDGYIVKQGDPVIGLYFVIRGQAKVVVDPGHHESQYPQFFPVEEFETSERNEELEEILVSRKKKEKSSVQPETPRPPTTASLSKRRKETADQRRRHMEICVIGEREIIGDVELSLDLPTYIFTIHCIQDTEVFSLDLKNYERLVTRKNPWSIQLMKDMVAIKLHCRILRLDNAVPILNALLHKLDEETALRLKQQQPQITSKEKLSPADEMNQFIPQRGPVIDIFGPGTVFYRNRMREKAKREAKSKRMFGAHSWDMMALKAAASTVLPARLPNAPADEESASPDALPKLVQLVCNYADSDKNRLDNQQDSMISGSAFLTEGQYTHSRDNLQSQGDDYETSDSALRTLEARMKHWHTLVDKIESSVVVTVNDAVHVPPPMLHHHHQQPTSETRVVQLYRFRRDEAKKISPGKKVFIRKRRPKPMVSASAYRRSAVSDDDVDARRKRNENCLPAGRRKAMSEGHGSQPSDTEGETDDEQKAVVSTTKLSPASPAKKHLLRLRKVGSIWSFACTLQLGPTFEDVRRVLLQ